MERTNIIRALAESKEPMSITEIAKALHANYNNVKVLVWKLKNEGSLEMVHRGLYKLTDPQEEIPF